MDSSAERQGRAPACSPSPSPSPSLARLSGLTARSSWAMASEVTLERAQQRQPPASCRMCTAPGLAAAAAAASQPAAGGCPPSSRARSRPAAPNSLTNTAHTCRGAGRGSGGGRASQAGDVRVPGALPPHACTMRAIVAHLAGRPRGQQARDSGGLAGRQRPGDNRDRHRQAELPGLGHDARSRRAAASSGGGVAAGGSSLAVACLRFDAWAHVHTFVLARRERPNWLERGGFWPAAEPEFVGLCTGLAAPQQDEGAVLTRWDIAVACAGSLRVSPS